MNNITWLDFLKAFFWAIFYLFTAIVSGQEKLIKYKVANGETLSEIAQKYKVSVGEINKLNPNVSKKLEANTVLIIPTHSSISSVNQGQFYNFKYKVQIGETVYGIAKKFNTSVDLLYKMNFNLEKEGLKVGNEIVINAKKGLEKSDNVKNETAKNQYHIILPKETKFAIASKYDISIEDLEKMNPNLKETFPVGYKLIIKNNIVKINEKSLPEVKIKKTVETVEYKIKIKETLYGLSRKFDVNQSDLIALNPELSAGVQEGMIIKVPNSASLNEDIVKNKINISTKAVLGVRRKLGLLLPFNISNIEKDTLKPINERLKKDAFLNMTLDFYSGALMAIDSAKVLGLNLDINIFDSQENKKTSNIENLIKTNNLQNYNALIGPFYQLHCDKAATLLQENNVAIISPLSKDSGKPSKNMFTTIPSSELLKNAMFDYMKARNGNIIAVVDIKKIAIKQYITENQFDTKFAEISDKGILNGESLKNLLVKDKINYVVLASEKTGMIFATTNVLLNALSDYRIRLVILENNETFDFEEIALSRLTKLNLTYPSLVRENNTKFAKIFEKNYRKKNKILPNQTAVRGFDITFDTMMRLVQIADFETTAKENVSEQIENKFDYTPRISGGYINKGIYILQYNNDLTITEAE